MNMLAGAEAGFTGFFDNIARLPDCDGLAAGCSAASASSASRSRPTSRSSRSSTLVLQVLGLTVEHAVEKLGEHIGAGARRA